MFSLLPLLTVITLSSGFHKDSTTCNHLCSIHAINILLLCIDFHDSILDGQVLAPREFVMFHFDVSRMKDNLSLLPLNILQRSWSKAPRLGTETARFSRKYFTTAAIVLGSISSAYAYFQSPFSQLCDCSEDESCIASDTTFQDVLLLNGTTVSSVETSSNKAVKFCNMYIRPFPPVPDRVGPVSWMADGQEWLSRFWGWFCLALLVTYLFVIWWNQLVKFVMACWKGMYKVRHFSKFAHTFGFILHYLLPQPAGVDQRKDFSSGIGIESFGYIPQVRVPVDAIKIDHVL
jgi:hypothetical protein